MSVNYLQEGSTRTLSKLLSEASSDVLFVADPRFELNLSESALRRLADVLEEWDAGIVYSDSTNEPRIDYQTGSIRDDFDFGPVIALSVPHARQVTERYGQPDPGLRWGSLYDLRLKLSLDHLIVRIPEPLYAAEDLDKRSNSERHFDYVDPSHADYQAEMEHIATDHLKRIGAYLDPPGARAADGDEDAFAVKASVVIPVRNRESTIRDAVTSALAQTTGFAFNVIVVDNHSTDATGKRLNAVEDPRLIRKVPERTDLGIGGCWNEAIFSDECGRFVLQLDSDDVLRDSTVLARVVEEMESKRYAMLVGSYTTVDVRLKEIPPGLVAHQEWTPENGHNNLLRVNGLGAPRAYDVSLIRKFGFPNVSYGEDYALGLRVCRDYEIGRIYDSLYLCRRWDGNTDSNPSAEILNRFNNYKDRVRTGEIRARTIKNRAHADEVVP